MEKYLLFPFIIIDDIRIIPIIKLYVCCDDHVQYDISDMIMMASMY